MPRIRSGLKVLALLSSITLAGTYVGWRGTSAPQARRSTIHPEPVAEPQLAVDHAVPPAPPPTSRQGVVITLLNTTYSPGPTVLPSSKQLSTAAFLFHQPPEHSNGPPSPDPAPAEARAAGAAQPATEEPHIVFSGSKTLAPMPIMVEPATARSIVEAAHSPEAQAQATKPSPEHDPAEKGVMSSSKVLIADGDVGNWMFAGSKSAPMLRSADLEPAPVPVDRAPKGLEPDPQIGVYDYDWVFAGSKAAGVFRADDPPIRQLTNGVSNPLLAGTYDEVSGLTNTESGTGAWPRQDDAGVPGYYILRRPTDP